MAKANEAKPVAVAMAVAAALNPDVVAHEAHLASMKQKGAETADAMLNVMGKVAQSWSDVYVKLAQIETREEQIAFCEGFGKRAEYHEKHSTHGKTIASQTSRLRRIPKAIFGETKKIKGGGTKLVPYRNPATKKPWTRDDVIAVFKGSGTIQQKQAMLPGQARNNKPLTAEQQIVKRIEDSTKAVPSMDSLAAVLGADKVAGPVSNKTKIERLTLDSLKAAIKAVPDDKVGELLNWTLNRMMGSDQYREMGRTFADQLTKEATIKTDRKNVTAEARKSAQAAAPTK